MSKLKTKLSILFASFAMAMGVGLVGGSAAKEVKAADEYTLVTDATKLTDGTTFYLVAQNGSNNYIADGSMKNSPHFTMVAFNSSTKVTNGLNENSVLTTTQGKLFKLEGSTGAWKITDGEGNYLSFSGTSNGNNKWGADDSSDDYLFNITSSSTYVLINSVGRSGRGLRYNTSTGDLRNYGSTTQNPVYMFASIKGEKEPDKTVSKVNSVANSPKEVAVGGTISGDAVTLNVTYSDNTTGTEKADHVKVDTSKVAKGVTATAYYDAGETNTLSATFTVDVIEKQYIGGIKDGGKYFITSTYNSKTYVLKAGNFAAGNTGFTTEFNINDLKESDAWTFTAGESDNTWSVSAAEGTGLYHTNNNNGVASNASGAGKYYTVSWADEDNGLVYMVGKDTANADRYLTLYTPGPNFRCYTSTSSVGANGTSQLKLIEYVKVEPKVLSIELTPDYVTVGLDEAGDIADLFTTIKVNKEDGCTKTEDDIEWVSSNSDIFHVDDGEWVSSPNEVGTVTLYAKIDGDTYGQATVEVVDMSTPILDGILVSGTPAKPTQYEGMEFDYTGLVFTPHYDKLGGDDTPIDGRNISWNTLVAGEKVTGTYNGITVTVDSVEVIKDYVENITVTGNFNKTSYVVGDKWNPDGLKINVKYASGNTATITSDKEEWKDVSWSFDPEDASDLSIESVVATATYANKTASSEAQSVKIEEKVVYTLVTDASKLVEGTTFYFVSYVTSTKTYYIFDNVSDNGKDFNFVELSSNNISDGFNANSELTIGDNGKMLSLEGQSDAWKITDGTNYLAFNGTSNGSNTWGEQNSIEARNLFSISTSETFALTIANKGYDNRIFAFNSANKYMRNYGTTAGGLADVYMFARIPASEDTGDTVEKFVNDWHAMREEGSKGICDFDLNGENALTDLLNRFEDFGEEDKKLIRSSIDVDDVTIGQTMDYINNVLKIEAAASNDNTLSSFVISISDNTTTSLVALFAILGLVAVSAYYFIEKKKLAR